MSSRPKVLDLQAAFPYFAFIGSLLLALALVGCASSFHTEAYKADLPVPPTGGHLIAGAAKREITPPPGYPLGGHSIAAPVARGQWMKLYARAFFLRDQYGTTLVMVSADLFGIPGGLHARVAENLHKHGLSLPEANLVIAATHTHQGPGNFLSSSMYNEFASNEGGYDDTLARFLANQITDAVLQAFHDAIKLDAPARVLFGSTKLCGLQRNRAPEPFAQDPERQEIITAAGCGESEIRYAAVDPVLRILEVDKQIDSQWQPVAILSFYAIHNTAMSHDTTVYSPDLSGYAMNLVEHQLPPALKPIAGFFNGAEGDISPRWKIQNRTDLETFGRGLAYGIVKLRTQAAELPAPQFEIAGAAPKWEDLGDSIHPPAFEIPALGGAEDGRSPLYNLGCVAGRLDPCGPKLAFISISQAAQLVQKFQNFPQRIPVARITVAKQLTLLTVPFEMTTTAGWRLRKAVAGGRSIQDVVIVGLANEYISYLATGEEQRLHAYEGASTVFGPNAEPMIERIVASANSCSPPCKISSREFHPGITNSTFGLHKLTAPRNDVREDLDGIFPDKTDRLDEQVIVFFWTEVTPTALSSSTLRKLHVESDTGTVAADDDGLDLVIVFDRMNEGHARFAAIWEPNTAQVSSHYRFKVTTSDGRDICSEFFDPSTQRTPAEASCQ